MDGNGLTFITIAIISLTVTVLAHIFVIARWSGRVDASLEAILRQPNMWTSDLNAATSSIRAELSSSVAGLRAELVIAVEEVKRLRESRHEIDGTIMRHDGQLRAMETAGERVERRLNSMGVGQG